jgi:hypothetical protein
MVWTTIESIGRSIHRYVCPLYWVDHRERTYVAGSGVPFEEAGFRCLLTAAHVCFDEALRARPLFAYGNDRPWALTQTRGIWQYVPGRTPDADVGVIALESDCADDIEKYYRFSTHLDLSPLLPRTGATCYILAGYSSSRNRVRSRTEMPSLCTFFVMREPQLLSDLKLTDKSSESHFALSVPVGHRRIAGGEFHLPGVHGMSGGGIWRFEVDNRSRLVTTPQLVGIAVEYHKKVRVVVGTHIHVAMPLVLDLAAQASSALLSED